MLASIFAFTFLISFFIEELSVAKSILPSVASNKFIQVLKLHIQLQISFPVPLLILSFVWRQVDGATCK